MRDALSLIDQAISYSDETVTSEDALARNRICILSILARLARTMSEKMLHVR